MIQQSVPTVVLEQIGNLNIVSYLSSFDEKS